MPRSLWREGLFKAGLLADPVHSHTASCCACQVRPKQSVTLPLLLQGLLVTLAIGLHNIPEGLAVATVLVARGISAKRAFWWTLFTAAPQPLVALPSFLFVDSFFQLLPLALGFAAGCMLWMVFAELLPDALNDAKHSKVGHHFTLVVGSVSAVLGFVASSMPWMVFSTLLPDALNDAKYSKARCCSDVERVLGVRLAQLLPAVHGAKCSQVRRHLQAVAVACLAGPAAI